MKTMGRTATTWHRFAMHRTKREKSLRCKAWVANRVNAGKFFAVLDPSERFGDGCTKQPRSVTLPASNSEEARQANALVGAELAGVHSIEEHASPDNAPAFAGGEQCYA